MLSYTEPFLGIPWMQYNETVKGPDAEATPPGPPLALPPASLVTLGRLQ